MWQYINEEKKKKTYAQTRWWRPPRGRKQPAGRTDGTETCETFAWKKRGCGWGWGVCNILVYISGEARRAARASAMIVFTLLWGLKENLCFHRLYSSHICFPPVCPALFSPHATETSNYTDSEVHRRRKLSVVHLPSLLLRCANFNGCCVTLWRGGGWVLIRSASALPVIDAVLPVILVRDCGLSHWC